MIDKVVSTRLISGKGVGDVDPGYTGMGFAGVCGNTLRLTVHRCWWRSTESRSGMRLLLKSAVGFIDLAVADHRPSLIPSPRTAHSRKFPLKQMS